MYFDYWPRLFYFPCSADTSDRSRSLEGLMVVNIVRIEMTPAPQNIEYGSPKSSNNPNRGAPNIPPALNPVVTVPNTFPMSLAGAKFEIMTSLDGAMNP